MIAKCSPSSTIKSSVAIVAEQSAMIGGSDMRFKIPIYTTTESGCPSVSSVKILSKGCVNPIYNDFSNSNDVTGTLSNGFWYALLKVATVAKTHEFCI